MLNLKSILVELIAVVVVVVVVVLMVTELIVHKDLKVLNDYKLERVMLLNLDMLDNNMKMLVVMDKMNKDRNMIHVLDMMMRVMVDKNNNN